MSQITQIRDRGIQLEPALTGGHSESQIKNCAWFFWVEEFCVPRTTLLHLILEEERSQRPVTSTGERLWMAQAGVISLPCGCWDSPPHFIEGGLVLPDPLGYEWLYQLSPQQHYLLPYITLDAFRPLLSPVHPPSVWNVSSLSFCCCCCLGYWCCSYPLCVLKDYLCMNKVWALSPIDTSFDVGAGNWAWVLYKSIKCFYLLSHFSISSNLNSDLE